MPQRVPHRARRRQRRIGAYAAGGLLALALGAAGCAGASGPALVDAAPTPSPSALAPEPAAASATEKSTSAQDDASLMTATPDEHSEVGDLVEGFPIDLLPVPSDAAILVTSAVPVGEEGVQEVSLNLRTGATADEVIELYRTALVGAGFVEVPVSPTGLAAESTFTRSGGNELVSIGVLDQDGLRTVTIGGRVHTAP